MSQFAPRPVTTPVVYIPDATTSTPTWTWRSAPSLAPVTADGQPLGWLTRRARRRKVGRAA